MFFVTAVCLLFLLNTYVHAQLTTNAFYGNNYFDPSRHAFNPNPPDSSRGGVHSPGWGENQSRRIQQGVSSSGWEENQSRRIQQGVLDVLSPGWEENLSKQIQQAVNSIFADVSNMASRSTGISVNTANGVTRATATIGNRYYTATFPAGTSISAFRNSYIHNGQSIDVFTIMIDGVPYTYTTINGRTTATDGGGRVLSDGGPFHVPTY
ncbi:hypothetical protein GCK32_003753 [Trichostrongylus colubriformis]|uniref:Uncharacterized protein n=1 Tax=Trichostrongylus colubriformis TaxID=6319 RepID=A0AAN8IDN5_TRICO